MTAKFMPENRAPKAFAQQIGLRMWSKLIAGDASLRLSPEAD